MTIKHDPRDSNVLWLSPYWIGGDPPREPLRHAELVAKARAALADIPWLRDLLDAFAVAVYTDGQQVIAFGPDTDSFGLHRSIELKPVCDALRLHAASHTDGVAT